MVVIVIEGPDKAGKSTLVEQLKSNLNEITKNPDLVVDVLKLPQRQSTTGEVIDHHLRGEKRIETPQALALTFSANKWEVADYIKGYKDTTEKILIIDRYVPSAVVYAETNGCDASLVVNAEKDLPQPDLIIWLDPSSCMDFYLKRVRKVDSPEAFETENFQKEVVRKFAHFFDVQMDEDLDWHSPQIMKVEINHADQSHVLAAVRDELSGIKYKRFGGKLV